MLELSEEEYLQHCEWFVETIPEIIGPSILDCDGRFGVPVPATVEECLELWSDPEERMTRRCIGPVEEWERCIELFTSDACLIDSPICMDAFSCEE